MYVIYLYQSYIKQKFEVIQKRVMRKFELPTLLGHLSVPPGFRGVPVSRTLALRVCFADRCLSLCPFSVVDLRILITTLVSSNSSC
jgi:hypothetical protein